DVISLAVDGREYQFTVPATLDVSKGDVVYIRTSAVTGVHVPPDAAYNTAGTDATDLALFRATADKDTNNVVTGILLSGR
ncbi:MAG: hypothetical protein GYB67_19320, partial [Chloroflexi bacterium]|nr:hypothetical protein [Chloroflexota bacterium]